MTSILTDWGKRCIEKLIKGVIAEARFVFCLSCIANEFDEERARLKPERETLGDRVKVAKRRNKDVPANVVSWEKEVDKLIQEDTKEKQTCFFGFCPDCIWRYKRGKKLANDTEKIKGLIEKAEKFGNIEVSRPPPGVERNSLQDYISFESRDSEYKSLSDALKDDSNFITGLQGMGGTGKTTLAIKVGRELKESGEFTDVIVTTVSSTPDIKKIQDGIAGPLGLKLDDYNESDRPGKLWDRLTNGDKILLILDDVWDGDPLLDFDAIGIPKRDNHKGCRVLVTTRSKQLSNRMNFDKSIELELLSKEDVWTMFKWYANISESSSKDVKKKGREIAKECKKLPVVIAVTASSLKGHQDRMEKWNATLTSLKRPITLDGVQADLVGVFNCLKVSYDNMNDEKAKGLFRLCSVFPEDEKISVEVLTRLSTVAGLFGEDYGSYNDARNQVVVAKDKLIDSCLLLEVDKYHVKMHDLIRDVARWIARKEIQGVNLSKKNQKSLIEKETNIKCLLLEGSYKDLFFCKFDGSKLETLIAREDRDEDCNMDRDEDCHREIPNSFFENFVKLRVLYLTCYGNRSLSLTNSFQSLKNIRSMMVQTVDLGDISALGNLQSLETLDLNECTINELPREIEKLEKFKVLKLKSCEIRKDNPFEVFKKFSSLEELYFIDSFNDFCREITLPTKLRRYHIGKSTWRNKIYLSVSKCVVLNEKVYGYFTKGTLKYFMETAEAINLSGIDSGWRKLMAEMVPIEKGMNDLVVLHLRSDSELQCLIDIDSQVPNVVFSKLAVLKLEQMERLEELCNGSISLDSLNNLEKLTIKQCGKLRSLFRGSPNICNLKKLTIGYCSTLISVFDLTSSQSLLQLETLKIWHCAQLENIFTYDGDNDNSKSCNSMFPNLKVLNIVDCPQLEFILPCHSAGDLLSLESISIGYCDKLKQLSKHPWDDTIEEKVDGDNDKNSSCKSIMFPNLKVVCVINCPQLEFVLPLQSAQDLLLLESIRIKSCDKLKHIFGQHQDVQLASLKVLELKDLPNFIDIFPESNHSMPSSNTRSSNSISKKETQLKPIKGQPKDLSISLERGQCLLRPSHIMCNIKEIILMDLSKIKSVFVLSITSRMMLQSLTIENCDELKHIIVDNGDSSGSDNSVFPNLKELEVIQCGKLEYIFGHIDDSDDHQNHNLLLPALKSLRLYNLPNLTGMCTKNYCTTFPALAELVLIDCSHPDIKYIGDLIVQESSGNVEHFVALEMLMVHNSNVESICCLNEVSEWEMNLGLQNIELYTLPMMTCLFKGLKKSFSLKNLTKMKIKGCEKLEFVFSTSIIMCLPQLLHIKIEECKELKHLIEDDLENRKTVCFPKLKSVAVVKCNQLKDVFPISICKVLPELEALMIKEADKLDEIFVCEEGDEKVNIPNLKFVAFVNLPSLCQTQEVHFQAVRCHSIQHCKNFSLTSAPEDIRNYRDYIYDDPEWEMYVDISYIIQQSQEETRDRDTCNESPSSKTTEDIASDSSSNTTEDIAAENEVQVASRHMLPSSQLEGSSSKSENPVAESLSTIPGTKNGPPIQVIDTEQKGVEISVEEGTALTNTKTTSKHTTSQDQSTQEGSTSGTKNGQDIQLDSHETAQTNNDQECKGCDNGNENPSVETTKDFDVGSKVQEASSGHEMTSSQLEGSTSEKTAAETKNESTTHLVSPKLKGIKISAEKGSTSTNAKTITSSTHLELELMDEESMDETSMMNPQDSVGEIDATIKPSQGVKEVGDGKIRITSFSIVNTEPPPTKDVDIGDSRKTIDMEDINKLIEEDPLLALEKLLAGQVSISSIRILLQELKSLMDSSSDLHHLISNQESKSKFICLFNQLNQHQRLLPSHVKEFVEKVQTFFIDNFIKYATFQQVLKKHNQLLDSKTDLVNKLWSAYSTQTHIDNEISTANARIDELSLQIDEHREKLEDIENQREDLKSVVNKCNVQKNKLKAECTEWAQQSKEILSALASSEIDVREAERAWNLATEGFENLKSSFPTF